MQHICICLLSTVQSLLCLVIIYGKYTVLTAFLCTINVRFIRYTYNIQFLVTLSSGLNEIIYISMEIIVSVLLCLTASYSEVFLKFCLHVFKWNIFLQIMENNTTPPLAMTSLINIQLIFTFPTMSPKINVMSAECVAELLNYNSLYRYT